jgi:hypothetical protein
MIRFMHLSIGVLCLSLATLIGFHTGQRSAQAQSETITAQRFVLVDSKGNKRGEWVGSEIASGFHMFHSDPRMEINMSTGTLGSALQLKSPTSTCNLGANKDNAKIGLASKDLDEAGKMTASGQMYLAASTDITQIRIDNPNKSSIEFFDDKQIRLILGNSVIPIRLSGSDWEPRPMGSIVVIGDSATVTIP